ncbi:MAG: hypothetical protein GY710_25135, partial [Desulfobacteraceae bacterium]|nr:hypothetical protein [Desulfobacteraceae bacterium]
MANIAISLEGIEQTLENLKYRPGSIKQKAVFAIQSFYDSDDAIKTLNFIDTDTLIKIIWNTGDDFSKIKSKRRNFSSLKSSINADLKKLSKKKLNPENIIIADANIFDMTEEAKSDLLNSFSDAVKTGDIDLEQAAAILKTITAFLETLQLDPSNDESLDIVKEIKKILNKISSEGLVDEDIEVEELAEDEELEEIEELDEDTEVEELAEDEELEEIEELDEDTEVEELAEDEELEEIEELDEETEVEELAEDEELEEIEELDEETEVEELAEDEELKEIEELDEETEVEELAEDEELEEIEELDEET